MTVIQQLGLVLLASEEFDPNDVTPTWIGFAITFLVAAATVLLILDMTRRMRRTRYRGEVREKLEAERLAAEAGEHPDGGGPDGGAPDEPSDPDVTPRAG